MLSNNISWTVDEITDNGERVTHLNKDSVYYAHLSIYDFGLQFCRNKIVLDAGCGSGYGSDYMAKNGADFVYGIDISEKAIEFNKFNFKKDNLIFKTMDLSNITEFEAETFDFIFSSNALEHILDVNHFFYTASNLLKPDGIIMIAVPPITDNRLLYLNVTNPYHLNLWSPKQWAHSLNTYFSEVNCYLHGVIHIGKDFRPEHFTEKILTTKDFVFKKCSIEEMYKKFTLTSIFVAKKSQVQSVFQLQKLKFIDDSFSRLNGEIDEKTKERLKEYFLMTETPFIKPSKNKTNSVILTKIKRKLIKLLERIKRI
ncbi:MAG: hypothetical protein CL609_18585 [Anaerolineaceae bacterium]|nr:hypothetical protein [Anaerolineaceae bacterium]